MHHACRRKGSAEKHEAEQAVPNGKRHARTEKMLCLLAGCE